MTTANDIKWGSYMTWEGPFWPGAIKYKPPVAPDFLDKCLHVVTSTEGGAYDAVNMYDRCILSVGLIQFCEAGQFSTTRLLGRCAELDSFMVESSLNTFPVEVQFKKNQQGIWRFYRKGIEVNTTDLQRWLYFGDSQVGQKGTWTPETKLHAKSVAAWFANFWDYPLFRTVQAEFTKQRLTGFLMPEARQTLFQGMTPAQQVGWEGALRAAFYSFAANLPAVANKSLIKATQHPEWAGADAADRFRIALQAMTFSPGIKIYPERYGAIAPVLKNLFGVEIPLKADDLKDWGDAPPVEMRVELTEAEKQLAERLTKLSEDLLMGRGEGLDALDDLMRRES